ncbi:hypothetical protein R50073_33690 [Maricurvus nonylphenolicus]|uniref:TetR/AcrR family transcriptional regulator n=1 Tax=Maricurvus nonylphenolicus TaxID=1008307 RepID=UPI0036F1F6E5
MIKQTNIEYLGRKAKRSDSQATLNAILEATLLIIAAEGISGIRHRLVAKRAGVPIGAISYYFKNKSDLIADAFMFYIEHTHEYTQAIRDKTNNLLSNRSRAELEIPEVRRSIAKLLGDYIADYTELVKSHRTYQIVDQAFRHEAVRNPRLAQLIGASDKHDIETFAKFFERLGSPDPEADAMMILPTCWYLSEESLLHGDNAETKERVRAMIQHTCLRLIAAPQPEVVAPVKKTVSYAGNAVRIG